MGKQHLRERWPVSVVGLWQAAAGAQLDLAVIGGCGVLRRRQVGAVAGNDTTFEANFRRGLMQAHGILQSVDRWCWRTTLEQTSSSEDGCMPL